MLNTTKGCDLRDENENKPTALIWLFLYKGKLTHTGRFRTSDIGLKVEKQSKCQEWWFSRWAPAPLEPKAWPALQRQRQEEPRTGVPAYVPLCQDIRQLWLWRRRETALQTRTADVLSANSSPQRPATRSWASSFRKPAPPRDNPASAEAITPHEETESAVGEAHAARSDPPAGSTQASQTNACPTSAAVTAFDA